MYPECMVFGIYIGNSRLRASPMYYCTSFSRRYIGIENSMPIPMYGDSNLSKKYIGMGQYRLFPMYRQKLPKQNTSEFSNFIQSRCISLISREYTRSPSRSISPRKQVKHKKYIGIQHIIAIPMYFINYLRFYLLSRAVFMSCILPRCSGYARWD